jgi:hypothetical protein
MKINIGKFPKNSSGTRKIKVQIDNYDTWNLDCTLALIIYPALLQLKATKNGVPVEFGEVGGEAFGVQGSFDFYQETHDESWKVGTERWDEILEKMIWSFEQILKDDYTDQYHHGDAEYNWIKSDKMYLNKLSPITGKVEATYQMVDRNPTEHWYDGVGHLKHEERIQEGLELFGKYFRSLWN